MPNDPTTSSSESAGAPSSAATSTTPATVQPTTSATPEAGNSAIAAVDRTELDRTPCAQYQRNEYLWRIAAPGLISTILIAIGALGVGWIPTGRSFWLSSFVDTFHTSAAQITIYAVILTIGVCGLITTWLQLGWDLQHRKVASVRYQRWTLLAWCMPLLLAPPLFSRDVYSYYAQGKLYAIGMDPFASSPIEIGGWVEDGVDPLWANAPSPYGQFWLLLARGIFSISGEDPYVAMILFRVLALIGVALLVWAIPTLAQAAGVRAERATWLAALNPLIILMFVAAVHNDALMLGMIAAGLALAIKKHPIWAIVVITLAASVKPVAALALPFVGAIWVGNEYPKGELLKRWLQTAAISAAIFVVLAVATGTGFGWLNVLSGPAQVPTWFSPPTALGLGINKLLELLGFHGIGWMLSFTRLLGLLAAVLLVIYLWHQPKNREPVRAVGLGFLILALLGPTLQAWYLLWGIVFLACAVLTKVEARVIVIASILLSLFVLFAHIYDGAYYS